MRHLAIAACALLAGACGQARDAQTGLDGCARAAAREVAWSDPAAPDAITASAQGPSCAQAIVTLTARRANGDLLWVIASDYYTMNVGDAPPETPPISAEEMDRFLASWADVSLLRASALPPWPEGAARIDDSATALKYDTALDRATYEAMRALDAPMLCYAAAVETSNCMIIDPNTQAPALIAASGL